MTMNYEHDYDGPDLSEDEIHDPLEEGEEPPLHMIFQSVEEQFAARQAYEQARQDAEDESNETLEAGAQILADRQWTNETRKAVQHLLETKNAEIERLRELVEKAFREGWKNGENVGEYLGYPNLDWLDWMRSDAKRALEGDDG